MALKRQTGRSAKSALPAANKDRRERLRKFLEAEIWPCIPVEQVGRRLSRKEEDKILGYGSDDV